MTIKLQHPDNDGKPITVKDGDEDAYLATGWVEVQPKTEESK